MREYGIIANFTAGNQKPSYTGYDLRPKNPNQTKDFKINDFELIFRTLSQEVGSNKVLDTQAVFSNIDKTTTKELEQIETQEEELTLDIQGSIIKQIIRVDGKYKAILEHTDLELANEITQKIFSCWINGKAKRLALEHDLEQKARAGTLDILNDNGNHKLVIMTDTGIETAPATIEKSKVKQTLFFITGLYKSTFEYQNAINCSHEENGYICKYTKGVVGFDKVSGDVSELEIAIVKDLKKLDSKRG